VSVEPVFYRLLPVHVTRRFIIASSSVALCTILGTMFSGIIWYEEPFLKKSIFLVLYRNLDIKLDSQVTSLCAVQYTVFRRNPSVILAAQNGLTWWLCAGFMGFTFQSLAVVKYTFLYDAVDLAGSVGIAL
jgi:hypothetical protein